MIENQKFLENVLKSISFDIQLPKKIKSFQELDQQKSIGYSYVLRVENYSGCKLEVEFYGGIIPEEKDVDRLHDSDISLDSSARTEFKTKLVRDESAIILEKPYILAVSPAEQSRSQQPENPLRMNVRLIDYQGNVFAVAGVDAENQVAKKCILESEQGGKQTKTVYAYIKVHEHYKTVSFYSQITIKNQLDRVIEVL